MEAIDIRELIKNIRKTVDTHEIEKGSYARWLWQDKNGTRELGVNEYGCADAANILYTLDDFKCDRETREARVNALKALQHPDTGMFHEATHHTIHTTAHCTAALELFDEKPTYPLYGLHKYYDKAELYALLDSLDWQGDPWTQSHQGAGVYAALANSEELTEEFKQNYFNWFWENADENTGMWKAGVVDNAPCSMLRNVDGHASLYTYMAAAFHYYFNHEYAKMPIRYPERLIDSCIKMYREDGLPDYFCKTVAFLEVDFIYCINRACRASHYRHAEVREILEELAENYIAYLSSLDPASDDRFNDLHMLFGAVCALAELQLALPGKILTEKPLRLVLDRRPFI